MGRKGNTKNKKRTEILIMKYSLGIFSTILFMLLTSCNQIKSDSIIGKKIGEYCKEDYPCVVEMEKIISGQWDTMFVFKEQVSLEEINKTIGFNYPFFEDIGKRILFIKDKEVVYHEDEFPNAESAKDGEIKFNMNDSTKIKSYGRKEAVFLVRRTDFDKGSYYELTPVK